MVLLVVSVASPGQTAIETSLDDFLPSLSASKNLNVRTPDVLPSEPGVKWSLNCDEYAPCGTDSSIKFIQLRISIQTLSSDTSWSLAVIDRGGRLVDKLLGDSFDQPKSVWTLPVTGHRFRLELTGSSSLNGLIIAIDKINYSHSDPEPKAIIGKDDLQDLVRAYGRDHRFYAWSLAVPVIFFQTVISEKYTDCTGAMLTANLLLTNYHCISDPKQLRTASVKFGFETGPITTEEFRIKEIVVSDGTLDFSVLRLDRPANQWSTVKITTEAVRRDEDLVVIQYPNGKPKRVSVIGCQVESVTVPDTSDFFHICDADGGSSGAPVMDRASGKVLGLHHLEQWNYRKKRDQNRAVRIASILDNIRVMCPSTYDEITSAGH